MKDNTTATITVKLTRCGTRQDFSVTLPSFGGSYATLMQEVWEYSQRMFGLAPELAEKLARQVGTDYHAEKQKADAVSKVKIGKTNKSGQINLKEACSFKGSSSPALQIGHAIQWAWEAGKNGMSFGHTDWKLSEPLQAYVNGLKD